MNPKTTKMLNEKKRLPLMETTNFHLKKAVESMKEDAAFLEAMIKEHEDTIAALNAQEALEDIPTAPSDSAKGGV